MFYHCVSHLSWLISRFRSLGLCCDWKNYTAQAFYLALRNIEFCGICFLAFLLLLLFPFFLVFLHSFLWNMYYFIMKTHWELWNRACLFQVTAIKKISLTSADCVVNKMGKTGSLNGIKYSIYFILATKLSDNVSKENYCTTYSGPLCSLNINMCMYVCLSVFPH